MKLYSKLLFAYLTLAVASGCSLSLVEPDGNDEENQTNPESLQVNDLEGSDNEYIIYMKRSGRLQIQKNWKTRLGKIFKESPRVIIGERAFVVKIRRSSTLEILKNQGWEIEKNHRKWRFPKIREKPQVPETTPWGIDKIDALNLENTGEGIKVCVSDTGIDLDHPDLSANIVDHFSTTGRGEGNDDNGHGTHVAGTIAAASNDIGVVGVAPKAKLIAAKALSALGSGSTADLAESITGCVDRGAHVINMSWGSAEDSPVIAEAIQLADDQKVLLVAAAGNDGVGKVMFPAAYPQVVAVSATDNQDDLASFSNYGPEIENAAPGVDINSTWINGGYKSISGTSMASPHVAGVAALLLSADPKADRSALIGEKIGLDIKKEGTRGRINAKLSLESLGN